MISPMLLLLLLLGAIALSAVAIGAALFFFQRYSNPEPSLIQQRLMLLKSRQEEEDTFEAKEQAQKLARLYKDADYSHENFGKWLEQFPAFLTLKSIMLQAGIKLNADKFVLQCMILPTGALVLVGLLLGALPLILLGLLCPGGAYAYVLFRRTKRLNKLITQLPDALSMITSGLRAGHSFQSALTIVSTELSDPVSTEFGVLVRDINLGIPVKEAMYRMCERVNNLPDVRMLTTAVMIQREAGGNLAEVLEKLGYTIRERFKLKGQIAALTGQSRLTGLVLGGAPAALLVILSVFMYEYVRPLWETEMGKLALGVAVVLQLIGFFVMRRIIDIRV